MSSTRFNSAYKRTPVAAIQRDVAIPLLDLFLQLQATQRAEDSARYLVTEDIERTLNDVWTAATRPPRRSRGRPRADRGEKPDSAMAILRAKAKQVIAEQRRAKKENGITTRRSTRLKEKGVEIDAYFTAEWRDRWKRAAIKAGRATTWRTGWEQQPLALYEKLPKNMATALFLLRTEVL
ncbi:hypothetical protein K402DRAFT_394313 [Aulographum hederae CBS 113979]|uniref:Uncharacterized protein n=1 Tax=Aulographum hederae CBS 113979 TaxID=1176131 RepID=A0A6G1GZA0_9PEZI|nr:hypothetical protein K402DRAFT_394313 [Aulographum hederae CBS 113979]